MANKRQLKRFIREVCSTLAVEIIMAREAFPEIERKDVHELVLKIARLQTLYLRCISIGFDRNPKDFESRAEYNKERRAYFKEAYKHLIEKFYVDYAEIVHEMNQALPEEVRRKIKEALAE